MMLVVTTTNGRPKALAALERWMNTQTTDDYEWLIVCDECEDYKFPKKAKVIKRDSSEDVLPSICHNWLAALDFIEKSEKYDKVVVMEDDDWYHPEYLRETRKWLDQADLVGWQKDVYYYVLARKIRRCHNVGYASLATTAFKRSALPWVRECALKGDVFIDLLMWKGWMETASVKLPDGKVVERETVKRFKGKTLLVDNFTALPYGSRLVPALDNMGNIKNEHPRHVGMKTNWHGGKLGLSEFGHDPHTGGGVDLWGTKIKSWLGEEAAKFFLSFTIEPVEFHPDGRPKDAYPANLLLPLPIEKDSFLANL